MNIKSYHILQEICNEIGIGCRVRHLGGGGPNSTVFRIDPDIYGTCHEFEIVMMFSHKFRYEYDLHDPNSTIRLAEDLKSWIQ